MHYGNLRIPAVFCPPKHAFLDRFRAPAMKMRQIFSFFRSDFSHLGQNRPRPPILYGSIKRWMNAELWALALNVRRSAFAFLLLSLGLFSDLFLSGSICLFSREIFSANLAPDVRENLFGRRLWR